PGGAAGRRAVGRAAAGRARGRVGAAGAGAGGRGHQPRAVRAAAEMSAEATPRSRPSLGLGLTLVGLLGIAWGCNWPVMRIVLAEVDVWTFRAVSCASAGLAFLAMVALA